MEINPADATDLGIADNELVRVFSQWGQVKAKARITEASPPGVVSMSGHFPRSPVNLLTGSALDPVSKIRTKAVPSQDSEKKINLSQIL